MRETATALEKQSQAQAHNIRSTFPSPNAGEDQERPSHTGGAPSAPPQPVCGRPREVKADRPVAHAPQDKTVSLHQRKRHRYLLVAC